MRAIPDALLRDLRAAADDGAPLGDLSAGQVQEAVALIERDELEEAVAELERQWAAARI